MARVTVEDCILKIPNRFKLVMLAAQRSRELSVGGELTVERDNDKNPVVALREIADETVDLEGLEGMLVQGLQKNVEMDIPIDETEEFLAVEEALSELAALDSGDDETDDADEATDEDDGMPDMGPGFDDVPGLGGDLPD